MDKIGAVTNAFRKSGTGKDKNPMLPTPNLVLLPASECRWYAPAMIVEKRSQRLTTHLKTINYEIQLSNNFSYSGDFVCF